MTDERGAYTLHDLQVGVYKVAISRTSFKTTLKEDLRIEANKTFRFEAQLEVGGLEETVLITAGQELALQTDRADVNVTQSAREINNLPLFGSVGRNYQSILQLIPGTTRGTGSFFLNATGSGEDNSAAGNPQRSISYNVNGVSRLQNNTRIDGASVIYPWLPTNMGNWHLIGIECAWPNIRPDGSYDEHQRWPDAQIISMRDTCAALTLKLGFTEERVIGHKEWAGRAQGKWDPGNIDMNWFRAEVAKDMRGEFDGHPPIVPDKPGEVHPPVIQPPGTPPAGAYADVLLHFSMSGPDVAKLQARLKRAYSQLQVDGDYGAHTASCVADYQKLHPPLDVDGIVGPATAAALQLEL
jgi:hypothetical protein